MNNHPDTCMGNNYIAVANSPRRLDKSLSSAIKKGNYHFKGSIKPLLSWHFVTNKWMLPGGFSLFVYLECRSGNIFWGPFYLYVFQEVRLIKASEMVSFGVHFAYELELAFTLVQPERCQPFCRSVVSLAVDFLQGKRTRVSKSLASKAKLPCVPTFYKPHRHLL